MKQTKKVYFNGSRVHKKNCTMISSINRENKNKFNSVKPINELNIQKEKPQA